LNVVGYIREPSNAESGDSMFAQSERVRMWVARHGYHLVAMCQDSTGTRNNLDGFRALLGIAARGQADLVVIPSLSALSTDKVVQEMMLMRLRMHKLAVASTERADHEQMSEPAVDPARMLVRDILHRIEDYRELLDAPDESPPAPLELAVPIQIVETGPPDTDVLIEFIEAPAAG
jgi:DNA invertase Pin-like site-specific DNA recombinase